MYAGKLRAETEEDVGRVRAERESRSALVVNEALAKPPLEFEGRKGCARAATRLRRTRESMISDQGGGGGYKRECFVSPAISSSFQ